jgi:hypothetical protein
VGREGDGAQANRVVTGIAETNRIGPARRKGGAGHLLLSPVPDEVFAGRLAEAEAESLKGTEPLCSEPVVREQDGNAGAPESKKTELEQG